MLKRLELVGFKSFADKTAFDFASGVTGIVGPNGSGKSNVVDAVRWVLGEQSARSLRGGEMTDVIFNGSASRRGLGLAEVTMTFDNVRRVLATAADEVQITRRVYRGGESEYLINGMACRLKDIKDLFLGSGAGTDAYSIIEQGRVDVLLQASTKDRRTIFEEAAGISRFKAKKTETLRRLGHSEQNLARLRDILEEVEKQLRSVKLQAAKAQRYQEHATRLKELRVMLGLRDYQTLGSRLSAESAALDALRAELAGRQAEAEAHERALARLEADLSRLDVATATGEAELSAARQEIAAEEASLSSGWAVAADLETDLAQTRQQVAALTRHVNALKSAAGQAGDELGAVEARCEEARSAVRRLEDDLRGADDRRQELHARVEREKNEHLDCMRQAARLQNDAVSFKARVDNLAHERIRLLTRSEQAAEVLASIDTELEELTAADTGLQQRAAGARRGLDELRHERERLGEVREAAVRSAAEMRERQSGLASRIEVLEGLERSREGLSAGVREVYAHLEQTDPGPWRTVVGLVADVLTVRREYAPLIDLALGEQSQRFLVRDLEELALALQERGEPFSGRVGFLALGAAGPATRSDSPALVAPGSDGGPPLPPGVVALAERVVRCDDPGLAGLPRRLLGRTLIVRDLEMARALAGGRAALRCVTLQGELVEADGTVTVGAHHAEAGVLSRKSELRELREQADVLEVRLRESERDLADLRERLAEIDGRSENQQREINVLAEQAVDLRARIGRHRDRRAGLHEEVEVSRTEITGLEQEIERLTAEWQRARDEVTGAEAEVQRLQGRVADAEREIRTLDDERQRRQQEALSGKVAFARVEERLTGLRSRHRQLQADLLQRVAECEEAMLNRDGARARLTETERGLLTASSALATWHSCKEAAERRVAALAGERAAQRRERQLRLDETQVSRAAWQAQREESHARELEVNDLRHRLDTLCGRLAEDYQLDLAALYREKVGNGEWGMGNEKQRATSSLPIPHSPFPIEGSPFSIGPTAEEANAEIDDLRRKLARLGSVNMDALQELTELEARADALRLQFEDMTGAQKTLLEIINEINGESRRLFTETFSAVRGHFQELFRKLFGGGMADVVLEDEADVLESGIEVVARPPGKELRSISLMSGGEKTLTAVALLLAVFRSKPSPFCILDEVDAALDEANIGRFTDVLRDFLDRSQFILITHSKRTMACADVLYGVTMAESGVSRRMAVRFEDWPDDERKPDEGAA
jgi:chromosome segregation protein